MSKNTSASEKAAFSSLLPVFAFIKPYKWMVAAALAALLVTAGVNLSLGQGVKFVIDHGFIAGSKEQLQQAVLVLIGLISLLAVGTFSRFYLMSWIGERVSTILEKPCLIALLPCTQATLKKTAVASLCRV